MIKLEVIRAVIDGHYINLSSEDIEELLVTTKSSESTVLEYEYADEELEEAKKCFTKLKQACRGFKGLNNISIQYLTMYKQVTNKDGFAFHEPIVNFIPNSIV